MVRDAPERRRQPRARFEGWVEITTSGRRRRARAVDLSLGGIGLRERRAGASAPVPPVWSEFSLPGVSPPLALESDVVWADPRSARMGLRFRALDPNLRELLERFLADRAR